MKGNIKKLSVLFLSIFAFLFINSCSNDTSSSARDDLEENSGGGVVEPLISNSRSESLDYIFSTDSIANITITISQEEWNNLLSYYDQNEKNEEYVKANFEMSKGSYTWNINDIGFRLRGNTSRVRPQLESGEYQQAHFKLDFEQYSGEQEKKLSGCIKGLNLKRFKDDGTFSREIYSYNYFRSCGVWTSPRASYAHLFIIITDENSSGETSSTELDYGIYAMIEETNKQFLKARTTKNGGSFKNNKGNLWKCTWANGSGPNLCYTDSENFGIEEISLTESESKRYNYDLKTNKTNLSSATQEFQSFITSLNALSSEEEIKSFYESKMDIDLFIKTYAINVILGMDDDYWRNRNNYYFYFDQSGKVYFIPYDYDNTLGTNCYSDTATQNPLKWGEGNNAPLVDKLLQVPEYLAKYKEYLLKYSGNESDFYVTKSQERINAWQNMISSYINSNDIIYEHSGTFNTFVDSVGSWCSNYDNYKLLSGDENNNYFIAKAKSIEYYTSAQQFSVTFDANGGTFYDNDGNILSSPITVSMYSYDNLEDVFYENVDKAEKNENGQSYKLAGFATTSDGTEAITNVSESCTVYAIWIPIYSREITSEDSDIHFFYNYSGTYDESSKTWFYTSGDYNSSGWLGDLAEGDNLLEALNNSNLFITKYGYSFSGFTDSKGNSVTTFSTDLVSNGIIATFTELSDEEISNIPYKIEKATSTEEKDKIVFTFVPSDFGFSSVNSVYLRGPQGWNYDQMIALTKSTDETWTVSLEVGTYGILQFKFYVPETDSWLGPKNYSKTQPSGYAETASDPNFIINY